MGIKYKEFEKDLKKYKKGILITSNWRKQAKSNDKVFTYKEFKNIRDIYLIGMIEGLEYSIKKDILHLRCIHLSGEFRYDSYYRLIQ